ncbi:protein unc-93 homolog A-like [Schistocerca serialis cubense]|uniref:protein unc-93 homolog A-like n=1 Tax=Schistocerca serialis cubense TaxID=2023355 RepID=UPI00214F0BE9|nr:protein unc-93 homolog A-like [Schistocerca serialis cubense]
MDSGSEGVVTSVIKSGDVMHEDSLGNYLHSKTTVNSTSPVQICKETFSESECTDEIDRYGKMDYTVREECVTNSHASGSEKLKELECCPATETAIRSSADAPATDRELSAAIDQCRSIANGAVENSPSTDIGRGAESESSETGSADATNGVRETTPVDGGAALQSSEEVPRRCFGGQVASVRPSSEAPPQQHGGGLPMPEGNAEPVAVAAGQNKMSTESCTSSERCRPEEGSGDKTGDINSNDSASTDVPKSNGGFDNPAFVGDGDRPPAKEKSPDAKVDSDTERGGESSGAARERRRIVVNVLVLSFAFLVHFTAYFGAANLQSSVNASEGLGTESLVVVYAALIVSSFFLPATVIRRLGCKWTLVASMAVYTPYLAAQFWATRGSLLPAAALVGLGGGPLWCAKCSYLTAAARRFASLAGQRDDDVQVRFFGVFFTIFPVANVLGNAISSLVLTAGADAEVAAGVSCGASFCPSEPDADANPNLQRPPLSQLYTLNGVFLGCMVAAATAVAVFLAPLDSAPDEEEASGLRLMTASARLLHDPLHCLVTPIAVFFGVTQGFLGADFTQAYVSCSWGIPHIGYVLMCYGAVNCASSAVVSWVSKSVGRVVVISIYLLFYAPILVTLFFWQPDPTVSTAAFFIFVSFWGVTDSAFLVVNALFGILFRGNEQAAYSNFRVFESVGFIVSYAYSPVLCTHVKLWLMAGLLAVAAGCYWSAEWLARRRDAASFWPHDKQRERHHQHQHDHHRDSYKKPAGKALHGW